ncbi:DUF4810 domain-containing protein [Acinetobacter larvae]|uniref:DUF4810 domain-containing protein n=1 Tax=Acinetobacter larvae TaxID=1789224 RepID=A0A1B2M2I3_9GAMM|nr:DUF4810 domain-containing protein [Acinetobacter larvae]AOA59397.1 DUF4810 domain-containing protein [Acinetobacter larvae]
MRILILLLLTSFVVGCSTMESTKPQYYWGSYPAQTYLMYNKSEKATPAAQIAVLEADIEKARAGNIGVAPGIYAHLGLMYLELNNADKAATYFELEAQSYPESRILMKQFLDKMAGKGVAGKGGVKS